MKRIGILKADTVKASLAARHGQYPDMFAASLAAVDPDLDFVTYDVERQSYPDSLDDCDGYVITGSRFSVYDQEPWIERLKQWVVEAERARAKLVGVCFGHQLVAHALGGRTELSPRGWTVGVQSYEIESPFPWSRPMTGSVESARQVRLAHSNRDEVTSLPDGAQRVASSETCPVAMYRIGDHVMCMQGHPEFTRDYACDLYGLRRESLGEDLYRTAVDSFANGTDRLDVSRWISDFFRIPTR